MRLRVTESSDCRIFGLLIHNHCIRSQSSSLLIRWQEEHPACKSSWVMRCWHVYLSVAGADDLHMVQLMPLPPRHTEWFILLIPDCTGCPWKKAIIVSCSCWLWNSLIYWENILTIFPILQKIHREWNIHGNFTGPTSSCYPPAGGERLMFLPSSFLLVGGLCRQCGRYGVTQDQTEFFMVHLTCRSLGATWRTAVVLILSDSH